MLYIIPDYYKEFQCIAGDCEDTCCAGWQIVVDEKSLGRYRKVRGSFRRRMLKSVNWRHKTFRQNEDRRCAFLNDNNLCDLYSDLGRESLCRTCRLYPRHIEEFEGVREITLSVSCPEAARILMNRMEPVTFLTVEREGEEEYPDFDPFLYSKLLDAREVLIQILQNRDLPLKVRTGLLYGIGRDMQRRINHQELFSCDEVLEKYKKPEATEFVFGKLAQNKNKYEEQYHFSREMFGKLYELEILKEDWYVQLRETELRLYARETPEEYAEMTKEFQMWMAESELPWEIQKEQLLVYFIFTYFCGAVYDGQILSKVQMAILSVQLLEEMVKACWLRNERILVMEDIIDLVYRYSREVEHSDINLRRMEKLMPHYHKLYD